MNTRYNPTIRLVEQNWVGSLQSFITNNRPFISDDFVEAISHNLSQTNEFAFDAGSGVTFHFEIAK